MPQSHSPIFGKSLFGTLWFWRNLEGSNWAWTGLEEGCCAGGTGWGHRWWGSAFWFFQMRSRNWACGITWCKWFLSTQVSTFENDNSAGAWKVGACCSGAALENMEILCRTAKPVLIFPIKRKMFYTWVKIMTEWRMKSPLYNNTNFNTCVMSK